MCVFPCFSQAQQSPRKKASKAAAASSVMDLAHLLKFCEDSKLLDTARGTPSRARLILDSSRFRVGTCSQACVERPCCTV